MKQTFLIFDDFYENPHAIRERALQQNFDNQADYYPGRRTNIETPTQMLHLKEQLEYLLHKEIVQFPTAYNTGYQYTVEGDESWIHHDNTGWAGVLFLTPNAPIEAGTGTFRHKETQIGTWDGIKDSPSDFNGQDHLRDMTKWEATNLAGNVFNRLVLYNGFMYHRSIIPGFGTDKYTGRLFQTFFFDTE